MRTEQNEVLIMEWQPIETAPKDGKFYLGASGAMFMVVNEPAGYSRGVWHKSSRHKEWIGSFSLGADELTHWMPLPEPPK